MLKNRILSQVFPQTGKRKIMYKLSDSFMPNLMISQLNVSGLYKALSQNIQTYNSGIRPDIYICLVKLHIGLTHQSARSLFC